MNHAVLLHLTYVLGLIPSHCTFMQQLWAVGKLFTHICLYYQVE